MKTIKYEATLSSESMKKLSETLKIANSLIGSNFEQANKSLAEMASKRLGDIFKQANLQNHISSIETEVYSDGFKISTSDWIVYFNEYGTGISNTHGNGRKTKWRFYKDGQWWTWNFDKKHSNRPKYMFKELAKELEEVIIDVYDIALTSSFNLEEYRDFRESMMK